MLSHLPSVNPYFRRFVNSYLRDSVIPYFRVFYEASITVP